MKQSIESIWKEGFLAEESLVAPKVNDLYNKKSENLIDKFHYMFDINRKAIIASAFAILLASIYFEMVYLGVFMFVSLFLLLEVGRKGLRDLEMLDKNTSSYDYLVSFVSWRKKVEARYVKTYQIFYPLCFLACIGQFIFTGTGQAALAYLNNDLSWHGVLWGMSFPVIAVIAIISLLLSVFAGPIYRLDLNLVYGAAFEKLDSLIVEMETLRAFP